jgi:hypothetical protein
MLDVLKEIFGKICSKTEFFLFKVEVVSGHLGHHI